MRSRRQHDAAAGRRSGPVDEAPWWDPTDQAFVEQPILVARQLGARWQAVEMPNNAERLDPYGDDAASEQLRSVRAGRQLTALDEGRAWRHRKDRVLVVARAEVFRTVADGPHRAAWQDLGVPCLDAVWRARWRERDQLPGWIEVRWHATSPTGEVVPDPDRPDLDWITVEDQTGSHETGGVTLYEHLTVWSGRSVAVLTVRHDLDRDVDALVDVVTSAAAARLGELDA